MKILGNRPGAQETRGPDDTRLHNPILPTPDPSDYPTYGPWFNALTAHRAVEEHRAAEDARSSPLP